VKRRLKEGAKNIAWNLNKERKRSGQPETKDFLSPLFIRPEDFSVGLSILR